MISILKLVFNIKIIPCLIVADWDLLIQLVKRRLHARYRGAALGLFWSVVQPLLMLSVYTFVFTFVFTSKFGVQLETEKQGAFAIIMFCGMVLFNIFAEAVTNTCTVLTSNHNLVKKVVFPLELLPLTEVFASFIFGLISFFLLFAGVCFILGSLSWTMLLLPFTLLPLLIFSCGIGFFVSSLGVYLKDLQYLITVLLQVLFFMTPIFYPLQAVPERFRYFLYFNPLCEFIEQTRSFFLYGQMPDWSHVAFLWTVSIIVFQLGLLWFLKTKKGFADVL